MVETCPYGSDKKTNRSCLPLKLMMRACRVEREKGDPMVLSRRRRNGFKVVSFLDFTDYFIHKKADKIYDALEFPK